ncbi:MAG: hypothetical protein JSW60_05250 [Thermoplasmatales archaeon]|nr:MAG: hypothetical protein JSW60_05250 [Thermoplasmatales archaeon]
MIQKKIIVVVIILLFISVAIAPSINANIGKDMVEFTTEVCGLNGGKQTVKLTQEEAEEVEALFNSIRERLNTTETREETEEIFKEAVVELDKYGLLGGLSVKQAQKLVTGGNLNSKKLRLIVELLTRDIPKWWENDSNNFCLVCGRTTRTCFLGMISPRIRVLLPTAVMNRILFGTIYEQWWGKIEYYPSSGWVYTSGQKGNKSWNGTFWGNLRFKALFPGYTDIIWLLITFLLVITGLIDPNYDPHGGNRYLGVMGFSGIKILFRDVSYFYLGFALRVGLTYETPEYP